MLQMKSVHNNKAVDSFVATTAKSAANLLQTCAPVLLRLSLLFISLKFLCLVLHGYRHSIPCRSAVCPPAECLLEEQ